MLTNSTSSKLRASMIVLLPLLTNSPYAYIEISKKYKHYEKMLPKSNQPGQLYDTGKTHKLNKIEYLTLCTLKFHFIIAQFGRHVNASHVMAEYLKPLCSDNEYIIRNTQKFPKMLHQQERLLPNEGYV